MAHRSKVIMMTCPGREQAAEETMAAFAAVGVPVDHVQRQTEEPSLRMNGVNYSRALRASQGQDAFVIEDDITPANTLSAWIEWVENQGFTVPVLFYLWLPIWNSSEAAVAMAKGGPEAPYGVEPIVSLRNWSGTIAVWWPNSYVQEMLSQHRWAVEAYELTAMDLELKAYMLNRNETPLVTIPHLVQHGNWKRITGGGGPHRATMFRPDALPPEPKNWSDTLDTMNLSPRKPRGKAKE
jgi:hypothetical protein